MQENQSFDKNSIEPPSIVLPKGGGAVKGIGETFQPDVFTGTGSYSINIPLVSARGFKPDLSLNYSTGSGNGAFGLGFSISLSKISIRTEKGIPKYDGNDVYLVDGNELVPKFKEPYNVNGYDIYEYLPRVEGNFSTIKHCIKEDKSESFWEIITNNNESSFFGQTLESRIFNPDDKMQIFEWLIDEKIDSKGNKIVFSYKSENKENLTNEIWEEGHSYNNKYIEKINYGNYLEADNSEKYAFEVIFDYGEYDITDLDKGNKSPHRPINNWAYRPDPFSSYKSGFEIRTCRLCKNILIFHDFEDELGATTLVKALSLDYSQSEYYGETKTAGLSALTSVVITGYRREGKKDTDKYEVQSMPPLNFGFSDFKPPQNPQFEEFDFNNNSLPGLRDKSVFFPIDLKSEGISGFLYSDKNSLLYLEAQGNGKYSFPEPPERFPIDKNFENGSVSFVDLEGNGELELVVKNGSRCGYYQKRMDNSWDSIKPFESYPTDYANPYLEMVSLSNNGKTDLILAEKKDLVVYPSIGKKGYSAPLRVLRETDFPAIKKDYKQEHVGFSDVFGDGLSHRIKISNGSVECWPDLGYGKFGKKVTFGNAPDIGDNFDTDRLFLTDIDGSGTTDIVYIYYNRVEVYLNQNGNYFSDPLTIHLPEEFSNNDIVSFSDVLGNGTTCLVFTKMDVIPRHYYYNFVGEIILDGKSHQSMKPYLLNEIDNNLGAVTQIQYSSSTCFYLEDKKAGNPWVTKLPFPVQLVEKVITYDQITKSRYTKRFKYHNGFYDYIEKEFRGFGYVETWDTEDYEDFINNNQNQHDDIQILDKENYVPPVHTKTWHCTGSYFEHEKIVAYNRKQYFQGDKQSYNFPDCVIDNDIYKSDVETIRQAYVAMKGTVLRTEIYAQDESEYAQNPYSVKESNVRVSLFQRRDNQRFAVYMVSNQENINYFYERNPEDPAIQQEFILENDKYGNVLQSCLIYLSRRNNNNAYTIYPEQQSLKATITLQTYVNPLSQDMFCHVACEEQNLELSGLDLEGKLYFSYKEIKKQTAPLGLPQRDNIIPYGGEFTSGIQVRQITWKRRYFWNEDLTGCLALKEISSKALLYNNEEAVFTDSYAQKVFDNRLNKETLASKGGYFFDDSNQYWWNRGLIQYYKAESKYYLPGKTENSFVDKSSELFSKTTIEYDKYCLFPVKVTKYATDDILLESQAEIDYINSKPKQLIDRNNNTSQILFDPLGQVIVTSIWGKENKTSTGGMTLYPEGEAEYKKVENASFDDVISNPEKYLQGACTYFYYNLHEWRQNQQPVCAINLIRNFYWNSPDKDNKPYCQITISYSDGLGRDLEKKIKTDPGIAYIRDPENYLLTGEDHQPIQQETENRWRVSGRTVYNNKGKKFEEYLPYYINTPEYEDQKDIPCPPPTVTHYDPLGREIRIDYPNEVFSTVEYHPWEENYFDVNNTIKDSKYYIEFFKNYPADPTQKQKDEKDALDKAANFYHLPKTTIKDNTGSVFLEINKLKYDQNEIRELKSYYETDILGRILTSIDPRLYNSNQTSETDYYNFKYLYAMNSEQKNDQDEEEHIPIYIDSIDAGTKKHLNDIFNKQFWSWSPRSYCQLISYDRLQRKISLQVKKIDDPGPIVSYDDFNLVEVYTYGDQLLAKKSKDELQALNLWGTLYQLNDLAGITINSSYSMGNEVLESSKQIAVEYKTPINWNSTPQPELQKEVYTKQYSFNAVNQLISESSPFRETPENEFATVNTYNQAAELDTVTINYKNNTKQEIIKHIEYDANEQRTVIDYGNGISTTRTYEKTTLRLINLCSTKPDSEAGNGNNGNTRIEDNEYFYDPIGNITRIRDNTAEIVFNNNQKIEPLSDFTYDSLYRLKKASGRQHLGITANTFKNNTKDGDFKQCIFSQLPDINDEVKLENYAETYDYDDSDNLINKKHSASSVTWSKETPVEDNCNHLKNIEYDEAGNMRQLDINNSVELAFNCCNNLVKTGIITRPDELDDCDCYVYDNKEQRTRKVSERMLNGGSVSEIEDKIYIGNYEIKRRFMGSEEDQNNLVFERQTIRIIDDNTCMAIIHFIKTDTKHPEKQNTRQYRFQMGNHLDSIALEMSENAQLISYEEYFPFGGTAIIAGNDKAEVQLKEYRYTGKERDDSTGLYYYGARYYIPWLGRWLKPDPAETIDGMNLFAFVNNNPITYKDNNGKMISRSFARFGPSLSRPLFYSSYRMFHTSQTLFAPIIKPVDIISKNIENIGADQVRFIPKGLSTLVSMHSLVYCRGVVLGVYNKKDEILGTIVLHFQGVKENILAKQIKSFVGDSDVTFKILSVHAGPFFDTPSGHSKEEQNMDFLTKNMLDLVEPELSTGYADAVSTGKKSSKKFEDEQKSGGIWEAISGFFSNLFSFSRNAYVKVENGEVNAVDVSHHTEKIIKKNNSSND